MATTSSTLEALLAGADDAPAVRVTEGGVAFTRASLRAHVRHVSVKLAQAGVKRGDVVSLCFANTVENAISFLAVTWLGAVAAPLNASYAREEFRYDMLNISSKFLIVPEPAGHPLAEEVAADVGLAVLSVTTGADDALVLAKARCAFDETVTATQAEPEDTALFLHTSGTTGKPKGVPLSHINMLTTMANVTETYNLCSADKSYLVMPLFHVHGLMAALFSTLYSGGEVILPARGQGFRVESFWADIAAYGATWYTAVPTMHQMLLKGYATYTAAGEPQVRFIRSCSASLPPSVLQELETRFKAPVLEAYAMTEAAHQIASNPLPERGAHKPGSVGKGTNVEVVILPADSEEPLAQGEVGEVSVRGKNVTQGYHNRPDANAESFTPAGFFRTGDLGYLDEDGYVFLTGRKKEQVNRGGEKIAPVAIDNVLLRCPGISSLFAFGVPHAELGEAVAVIVVLDKGAHVSLAQLNRFGLDSGELSLQWLPEVIVYSDKVPKGPTGKVQRVKLASMLQLPTLTQDDTGAAFRFAAGVLERLPLESASAPEQEATLPAVESALGALLGLDLSGVGEQELMLDSFTAARVAAALNARFRSGVAPKALLKGVTLPRIFELVVQSEAPDSAPLDWEAEAAVPDTLAAMLSSPAKDSPLEPAEAVLLTGATGFLGAHLLAALLRTPHAVVCVVRADDAAGARSRVERVLREQGEWRDDSASRVRCLVGDVSAPNLGLVDVDIGAVRLIVHNAAAVNHASAYTELKAHNVGSVEHALGLAHALEAKSGKAVHVAFVSSAAVCGRVASPDAPSPPRIGLADVDGASGYVQSKWVAERMVENANAIVVSAGGSARFSIVRPGAITGHTQRGVCNLGDSINRYMIGFSLLGSAPPLAQMDVRVDMSPVDWVAAATVGLALQDVTRGGAMETPCYTLDNGASRTYEQLLQLLRVPAAPTYAEWLELLSAALEKETDGAPFANPLRGLYGALRQSPPKFGSTSSVAHMRLLEERGFASPVISEDVLRVYLTYFEQQKALPAGSASL